MPTAENRTKKKIQLHLVRRWLKIDQCYLTLATGCD